MEETPIAGDILKAVACDRLGGWWFHLPNLDVWFLIGRDLLCPLLCPLIMSKMLLQWWWTWIFVFSPSCMASMEVKLSPIEVEIWCELLETPSEGDNFMATACDRLGGWWLHLPNLDVLIFLPPIFVVGDPFTIEVGKETAVSWKIFEGAGLRKGPRWIQIFGSEKKG